MIETVSKLKGDAPYNPIQRSIGHYKPKIFKLKRFKPYFNNREDAEE